jgi:hypothetical protein
MVEGLNGTFFKCAQSAATRELLPLSLRVTSCPFIKAERPCNPWTVLTIQHLGLPHACLTAFRPVKNWAGIATEETTVTEKPPSVGEDKK